MRVKNHYSENSNFRDKKTVKKKTENKKQIRKTKQKQNKNNFKTETQQSTQKIKEKKQIENRDPTEEDSTADSIPDVFEFFQFFSKIPNCFLQNQHFAAKLSFLFII